MGYYISTKLKSISFDQAIENVTQRLKEEGFGVLTDIDMKATLKKKLDVNLKQYRILGACNPTFAHKALLAENKIGIMLPCNVIVQELDDVIEISAVDPLAAMSSIGNSELTNIASEVQIKLKRVIDNL